MVYNFVFLFLSRLIWSARLRLHYYIALIARRETGISAVNLRFYVVLVIEMSGIFEVLQLGPKN